MVDALFDIDGDGQDRGFDAAAGQTVALTLRINPSSASSVRFQIWDPAGFDPKKDPIVNPPLKSKDAPVITLQGSTTGSSVAPSGGVNGTVSLTLPEQDFVGYLLRCVVNGGQTVLPDGRVVFDPRLVHERMIVVRDGNGDRPIIATETLQYESPDGWAGAFKPGLVGDTGPTGPTGPTGAAFAPATGSAPGYLERHVYVNASSAKIGTSFAGVQVEAVRTYTTSADLPAFNFADVVLFACGGPGSGANQNASSGGYPGGGGCYRRFTLSRREFLALLPFTPLSPLGPVGGVGTTSANPGVGVAGAPTEFGPFKCYPGGAGARGETTGRASATGGGSLGTGASPGTSTAPQSGGLPGDTGRGQGTAGAGSPAGSASSDTAQCAEDGGASGANVHSGSSGKGARATRGGGGGGAGGQWNAAGAQDGGDGGASGSAADTELGGGGLGGAHSASGGTPGADGGAGPDGTIDHAGGGGGGGGAGGTSSGAGNGGKGGAGGFPGGGSGGGGGSGAGTGGDGGKSADAAIAVTFYA